jgi:GxxExxY protein
MMNMVDQHEPQIDAILSAATEIHHQLGHGFVKAVYKDAAAIEFSLCDIPFQREALIPVKYKDHFLPTHYRADFICFSDIFVEFESVSNLSCLEETQALNCLKATGMECGLLINFGAPDLQYKYLSWGNETILDSKQESVRPV